MLTILTFSLVLALAGCAAPGSQPSGLSTTEVCERLVEVERAEGPEGTLAERNRETAEELLVFAEVAQEAADPELGSLGERLELHARSVLDRLEPDATDDQARLVAEPMLRESIRAHSGCIGHLAEPESS